MFFSSKKLFIDFFCHPGFGMQSSESKGRRAAAQSAQSEGSSSSERDDQIEKDKYLSGVRIYAGYIFVLHKGLVIGSSNSEYGVSLSVRTRYRDKLMLSIEFVIGPFAAFIDVFSTRNTSLVHLDIGSILKLKFQQLYFL